ncbi:MAG: hypothetical protein GEU90_17845 [Gemmatimonas sp.]|nr:hypothetical protein [Gemmatimonas sp.]
MIPRRRCTKLGGCLTLASATLLLIEPATLASQVPVVVEGRVEDAESRNPVEGARIFSADSSTVVLTDSLGAFTLRLSASDSLSLHVERIGYLGQRFDLPQESLSRISVLLLEPAAVALQGVTVVAEQAIEVLQQNLKNRRNAYPHAMRAFDREWLDRFAPIGSVLDLVRQRIPRMLPCDSDPAQMCLPGRAPTFQNPFPTRNLTVCIDGRKSIAPIPELDILPIDDVALVELYGRDGVKVYTADWILISARTGRTTVMPDNFFGLQC